LKHKVKSRLLIGKADDRSQCEEKGAFCSEEIQSIANEGEQDDNISDRRCRQFEPDRSNQKETEPIASVFLPFSLESEAMTGMINMQCFRP
jgi:hypothetical protein